MDNIRPIKTEADYEWALAEVTAYFDNQPEPGSLKGIASTSLPPLSRPMKMSNFR